MTGPLKTNWKPGDQLTPGDVNALSAAVNDGTVIVWEVYAAGPPALWRQRNTRNNEWVGEAVDLVEMAALAPKVAAEVAQRISVEMPTALADAVPVATAEYVQTLSPQVISDPDNPTTHVRVKIGEAIGPPTPGTATTWPLVQDKPDVLVADVQSPGTPGVWKKLSTTHGPGWIFGDYPSYGFAGTGSPTDIAGRFGIYGDFGRSSPGVPILKTTQGGYAITNYWGPTSDDVMEGFSSAVLAKDGGVPYTQSLSMTALEGISQAESGVTVTGKKSAVVGTSKAAGTAHVTNDRAFLAQTQFDGTAVVDEWIAYEQRVAGQATVNWGVKVVDRILTQKGFRIDPAGGNGTFNVDITGVPVSSGDSPFARLLPPSTLNLVTLRLGGATGQTKNITEWWAPGASTSASYVDSGGALRSKQGIFCHNSSDTNMIGLTSAGIKLYQAALMQNTVGASGGASAPPSTPATYMKVLGPSNQTYLVPLYAAPV